MRLLKFYDQMARSVGNGRKHKSVFSSVLGAALLIGSPFAGYAAPVAYTGTTPASATVCMGSGANSINALLTVTDPDVGETITWTLNAAAMHGTVSLSGSVVSTGGSVMPSAASYTPNPGYYGPDMFAVDVTDGTTTVTMTINVMVVQSPVFAFNNPAVCFGATTAQINYSTTIPYAYTGGAATYVVPEGVANMGFDLVGASGGRDTSVASMPGKGGRVQGNMTVTTGDELTIVVGGRGADGSIIGAAGGYNGGGASFGFGGSGGGHSHILLNGSILAALAGGGAGAGHDGNASSIAGGDGGGLTGADGGMNMSMSAAGGGSATIGGLGATYTLVPTLPGQDGASLQGGDGSLEGVSGGGGGGYYGGGGGAWSGGGGGSSFTNSTLTSGVAHTQGFNTGDGAANLSFTVPASYTYTIDWDNAANTAGFTDVTTATAIPASSISVAVPSTAGVGIYSGIITVHSGACSEDYAFTVNVKQVPDVTATTDVPALCATTTAPGVAFTGTYPGTVFNWTNSATTIGLGASGTGDISSFTAANTTTTAIEASVIVTPELNGCFGTPDTFTYTVKPLPTLTSATTNGYLCDNTTFNYTATTGVAGATFAWTRNAVAGISAAGSSASVATVSEVLDNTTDAPIPVTYNYTITANGCTTTPNVLVTVNPTPSLFPTPLAGTICSGDAYTFTQNSLVAGVTYSWSRAAVAGISTPAASGVGNISEVLVNTTPDPIVVTYVDTLNINGCRYTENLITTVNPMPVLSTPTTANVCNNGLFDYNAASATAGTTISWSRATVVGISTPAASGTDTVEETLTNVTEQPITVNYVFTLVANGCTNTQTVAVVVNPSGVLNTTLTPASICDSTLFSYTPGSNTIGATFSWSRAAIADIANAAATGTDSPEEYLDNTKTYPVAVTYVYSVTINGCSNTQSVVVNVNPTPRLSNPAPSAICDSSAFVFNPASMTTGSTYEWSRAFVSGIANLPANGTAGINEYLDNNTNANIQVPYTYTVTANGCAATQVVRVTVHPTPRMASALTDSACSAVPFNYTPATYAIPAVTYAWSRSAVAGISNTSASGTGNINETLVNTTLGPIAVAYVYTLNLSGCTNTETVSVIVRPAAAAPAITTNAPSNVCAGAMYQNFGAATEPASGVTYTWGATNGEIYATGANNQYAVVNFATPGTAVISLTATIGATGCIGVSTYTVNVGATANTTSPNVIRNNGKLICLQTDVKSYQWGYDDHATLDSNLLAGEINQSYFLKSNDDFNQRYFWVMTTTSDGCVKKSYYNRPLDNTPRTVMNEDVQVAELTVYPNPASSQVNIQIASALNGAVQLDMTNAVGQVLSTKTTADRRTSIDVANLPAGMYLVDCYVGGVKVGTAKFVKN